MRVELVPHDPTWAGRYELEAARIRVALGDLARWVEHVGSTAVRGIVAKPVVDIQVSVPDIGAFDAYAVRLLELGYEHRSDDEPAHEFFFLDEHGRRVVNVHVCEAGSEWERRHLAFRDALRSDPALRSDYERLKRALAEREWEHTDDYADAKESFIRAAEQRIGA